VITAQSLINAPMHPFGLVREAFHHARAASQPHSDFLCLPKAALVQGFMLAFIHQGVATPAGEQFAGTVQQRRPAPAVAPTGIDGADEPGATTAKMACRPDDWHSLFDGLPLGVSVASRAIHQDHGVCLGTHVDIAGRVSTAGPGPREELARAQPSLAMPAPHVNRLAAFTR
jgi:hypothetical protein